MKEERKINVGKDSYVSLRPCSTFEGHPGLAPTLRMSVPAHVAEAEGHVLRFSQSNFLEGWHEETYGRNPGCILPPSWERGG